MELQSCLIFPGDILNLTYHQTASGIPDWYRGCFVILLSMSFRTVLPPLCHKQPATLIHVIFGL